MSDSKKCMRNRGVDSCEKCLHYQECFENKLPYDPDNTTICEQKLLKAIVVKAVEDYENAWKHAYRYQVESIRNWLRGEKVYFYTCGEYDGGSLETKLRQNCERKYGKLNDLYAKRKAKIERKIEFLNQEIKNNPTKKKEIIKYIYVLKGELNK